MYNDSKTNMEKIVYLFGTGSTCAEMNRQGIEADVSMKGIGKNVIELSRAKNGEYCKLQRDFKIPEDQDIEIIMSLMEGFKDTDRSDFKHVCDELRILFRLYLISQISEKNIKPKINSSLLHIHKNYGLKMGAKGEELTGILTTNYDCILDDAFIEVFGGINYGYNFESDYYRKNEKVPPLLKLHGSFNWRLKDKQLLVSKEYENRMWDDDRQGWMPPSVFKKPSEAVFQNLWDRARELIIKCDVLRIIGSSLRTEDFALISLIFTSQLKSDKVFNIELIVPDKDALGDEEESRVGKRGVMQRLPFLGKLRNFSALSVFEEESVKADNVYYSWVLMKLREIERNMGGSLEDEFIDNMLLMGGVA